MSLTDTVIENVEFDLILMGSMVAEGDHEGGEVVFSVKELLLDISQKIEKVGETTKADLQATELRITTYIHNVDAAAKERDGLVIERVKMLEDDNVANKIQWAKVAGIAGLGSLFGGGTVAILTQALT